MSVTWEVARRRLASVDRVGTLRRVAAAATMLAGAVHYAVVPGHREDAWWMAVAFTGVGAAQLVWGVLAWQLDHRTLLRLGLSLNLVAVALWATSRIWGVPFGPHVNHAAGIGADLACVSAELVAVAAVGLVTEIWGRDLRSVART